MASRRRSAFGFSTNSRAAMRAARVHMRGPAFGDRRRQPRAPARQRLVRPGEALEHQQVLVLAEPVAQPLRLAGPHLARSAATAARRCPSDSDGSRRACGTRAAPRRRPPANPSGMRPRARAIEARELVGDVRRRSGDGAASARPAASASSSALSRRSRMSGLSVVSAALRISSMRARSAGDRARRERETVLLEIRERIERRLRVARARRARARDRAPRRAAAWPPRPTNGSSRRSSARQRFIARRKSCTALGVGFRWVVDRRARLGEDVAGHRAQRLPHRHARPHGGPVVHAGELYDIVPSRVGESRVRVDFCGFSRLIFRLRAFQTLS